MKCQVLKGRVAVTRDSKTRKVRGVWKGQTFHSPKSNFTAKGKRELTSCVRIAGKKRKYYAMKRKK